MDEIINIPINGNLRPDLINDIRAQVARTNNRLKKHGLNSTIFADAQKSNLLLVKPAAKWIEQERNKPAPGMLFGEFWFENELCVLFADTNLGKSILAVQIANHIAGHTSMPPFANDTKLMTPVLYVDFEMSAKQFESRYTHHDYGNFTFAEEFYRAEFNPEAVNPALYNNYDEYLAANLESAVRQTDARVLIIDNLTYMRSGTERAKDALPLMKQLKALKTRFKLSMLVLAHTPKRSLLKPITVNDLQGSKMIINFCDSAFAIGESHTVAGGRYLKQIKQRNAKKCYGEENVCLCHIAKDFNNLQFVFDDFANERDHLKKPLALANRQLLQQQVRSLAAEGKSYTEISQHLDIGRSSVGRIMLEEEKG